MENIKKMRAALDQFIKDSENAHKRMRENKEIYREDLLDKVNRPILDDLRSRKIQAATLIAEAAEAGRKKVNACATLDGGKVPEDAKLLEFDMTQEQFNNLAAKHKDNGTMIELLRQYGERHNKQYEASLFHNTEKYIYTDNLPSAEKRERVYDEFYKSALSCLDGIEENPADGVSRATANSFGDYIDPVNSPLLELIK